MGTIEDVIDFLRFNGVIKGNTVSYNGIIHYAESVSIILGLSPEESIKELLSYLNKNGYVVVG
ncbi:SIFV.gp6-like protein [Sulfolobus islandicus filamentous virus 2]|uniref:SIFV.gp6-like protein n=1 Tax=Sulfolobus islandicus filamentous virus 2 TaxID=1902331 RepID=A0A1D8BJC6_SIFV|nr:SIFV.gp6-like protein [Sulfolobus islandicus filamentous virus 2]